VSKLPALDPLDPRLNASRPDLADIALKGKVSAERFVEGTAAQISVAFTDMRANPDQTCSLVTQLLYGETVRIFDAQDDGLWVKNDQDGYVGWLDADVVTREVERKTHVVCVPRTFFYPAADLKLPHKGIRSMGSLLKVVDSTEVRGTAYAILAGGEAVFAGHIRPLDEFDTDYVSVAEGFLGTPYLWGGTTAFGLDCSGLVKLAFQMTGKTVLRDSDMQAATIGVEIDPRDNYAGLERGDLVFWRSHVGICQGGDRLIHANAHTMDVASEPLEAAIKRIAYLYEMPIGYVRP